MLLIICGFCTSVCAETGDVYDNSEAFVSTDSFVVDYTNKGGNKVHKVFDLRVEPDTFYRRQLHSLMSLCECLSPDEISVLSGRESYLTLAKQVLTELDCSIDGNEDCCRLRHAMIVKCRSKEYLRQMSDILYEKQEPLVLYSAWENFDQSRCPWYKSYRDSVLANKSTRSDDLLVLIVVNKNVKNKKEYALLLNEYNKLGKSCTFGKCFQYLLDNNDVLKYQEYRNLCEIWVHENGYWDIEFNTYSQYYGNDNIRDPLCYLLFGKLMNGTPMFVTSLSCVDEITKSRILCDLEIPLRNRFDIDKCIETVEKENPADKKMKSKVLKALKKQSK